MSRAKGSTVTFEVRMKVPAGSNTAALTAYIRDAIASWGGGLSPDNPLFGIKGEDFIVKLVKKETVYG